MGEETERGLLEVGGGRRGCTGGAQIENRQWGEVERLLTARAHSYSGTGWTGFASTIPVSLLCSVLYTSTEGGRGEPDKEAVERVKGFSVYFNI